MGRILVGRYLSPWARRVGVSMQIFGIPYEQKAVSALKDPNAPFAFNPVGRVPALVLESGETLIESSAICDWLDEEVGPDKRLMPLSGIERRRCQQTCALMTGAIEKTVASIYERVKRPEEKWHLPWIEHLEKQASGGLRSIEDVVPASGWFGGDKLDAADVLVGVGFRFMQSMAKGLVTPGSYPKLESHSARCEALPAFKACALEV